MRLSKKIFFNFFVFFLVGIIATAAVSYFIKYMQVHAQEQKQKEIYNRILDGASIEPIDITVDYSKNTSTGSPLIFGGNHGPNNEHYDAWDKIAEIGVTSVRKDLFPELALPWGIQLEDYKNNANNMQDISTWNWSEINKINGLFKNAKEHNMKTFGIVAYIPAWLSTSNKIGGVPKDWDVYEDIVKKTYKIYRDKLDYLEIWNEPNWDIFLNTDNSGMSKEEAYAKIYYHAAKAIREVDHEANDGKIIPLGGPATSNPIETSTLEAVFDNPQTKDSVDFISYHNYESKMLKEPSWDYYKSVLVKYGKSNLPIYITEWNYEPDSQLKSEYNTENMAIPFTGRKFVEFLEMGLSGANYHVLEPLNLRSQNKGQGYMGFYRWENEKAELLPQARTWRLMSSKMKLGKGPSLIYSVNIQESGLNIIGFKNSANQYGVVVVNSTAESKMTFLSLKNIGSARFAKAQIYEASADNEAKDPIYDGDVKLNDNLAIQVYAPSRSVVGLLLTEDREWFDFINL